MDAEISVDRIGVSASEIADGSGRKRRRLRIWGFEVILAGRR